MPDRYGGCWLWRRFTTDRAARRRRASVAWIARRCAIGCCVEAGPDPEKDGVARWRCVDLKRVLGARFAVDLSEVSLGRVLRKLGFSHISARPRHPKQDPEAIANFKKKFFRPACWRP